MALSFQISQKQVQLLEMFFLTEIRGIIPAKLHSLNMSGHRVYAAYYAAYYAATMMFQEWRGDQLITQPKKGTIRQAEQPQLSKMQEGSNLLDYKA